MRLIRKLVRLLMLLVTTGVGFVCLWAALVLLLPVPHWRRAGRNAVFRVWSRGCLRLLGGRLRVEGTPPTAPFFLVTNHLSYVDILALAACADAYFIAKLEIRAWPLFGVLCRAVGTIFVDREVRRDVLRENLLIAEVLAAGYGVVLFPEGTSTQGYEVARFRSSLLDFPARNSVPVHVAALTYTAAPGEVPANLSICWWGDAPFFPHSARLLGVRSFEVVVRFSDRVVGGTDRKQLAVDTQAEASKIFTPVVASEERAHETGF